MSYIMNATGHPDCKYCYAKCSYIDLRYSLVVVSRVDGSMYSFGSGMISGNAIDVNVTITY